MKECRKERQKRLIEVYDHLRRFYGVHTKTGFADAVHYGRTSMSAALNGKELYLTDNLFENICRAYPGVFNIDYLLNGTGELLTIEEEVTNEELVKNNQSIAEQAANIIDLYASLIKEVESLRATLMSEINLIREERIQAQKLTAQLRNLLNEYSNSSGMMAAESPEIYGK